jgi:copper chaperone CopZ
MQKIFILAVLGILFGSCAIFQKAEKKTVQISTNAECGMCKERIEGELNYVKGIVFAELDVSSKILTVKYKSNKIQLEDIRKKVTQMGYDADAQNADAKAQSNLPDCCKPGGHETKMDKF